MKTKHNLIENKEIEHALIILAESRLTNREKQSLRLISIKKHESITKLVEELVIHLNCSESAVWNILRSLSKLNLIERDQGSLKVTKIGNTILGVKND